MKILNFGSLNIDYVYNVDHIVTPGETISSTIMKVFPGGKGLNQTLALARAGVDVYHAGMVGEDGKMLIELLEKDNVNCKYIRTIPQRTGSAFIQVDQNAQNSIVLYGGANKKNSREFVDEVLANFCEGDIILLQNEINLVDYIIQKAYEKKMVIAFNPSPLDNEILKYDLDKISFFIMNEVEGEQITGEKDVDEILAKMKINYPQAKVIMTQGRSGVVYQDKMQIFRHGAYQVEAVDTTAAGDTFTGYFIASLTKNEEVPKALFISSKASGLAVTKKGAANSIPYLKEVLSADMKLQ